MSGEPRTFEELRALHGLKSGGDRGAVAESAEGTHSGDELPTCCAGEGYPGIAHDLNEARRDREEWWDTALDQKFHRIRAEAELARVSVRAERLAEGLGKAAVTFSDFAVALELLGRYPMAEAARIAEEGCRAALAATAVPEPEEESEPVREPSVAPDPGHVEARAEMATPGSLSSPAAVPEEPRE